MYICMYVHVCMCASRCMHVAMYVRMYVGMSVIMYLSMYVSMYLWIHVCKYVCRAVRMYVCERLSAGINELVCKSAWMNGRMSRFRTFGHWVCVRVWLPGLLMPKTC